LTNLTGFGSAQRPAQEPVPTPLEISALVADDLEQVEELFAANLDSPVSIVNELGEFVAHGGGKRVRPTLHLLASRMCGKSGDNSILLATVLEFIHSATLIHDDIIDSATVRRGRPSVNFHWGSDLTVLFGDYLFAKAMEMALQAENLLVMKKLAEVTLNMTEGEMLQTRYAGRTDLTVEEHVDLVERKTARLFACCCELAGMQAGVEQPKQAALRRYGLGLGMAFQLVDDLLDLTGNSKTLGKPAVKDLQEGKTTFAVIDFLGTRAPGASDLVRRIIDGEIHRIPELTEQLHRGGHLEAARRRARGYADAALAELELFDDSPSRRALQALPEVLLSRHR